MHFARSKINDDRIDTEYTRTVWNAKQEHKALFQDYASQNTIGLSINDPIYQEKSHNACIYLEIGRFIWRVAFNKFVPQGCIYFSSIQRRLHKTAFGDEISVKPISKLQSDFGILDTLECEINCSKMEWYDIQDFASVSDAIKKSLEKDIVSTFQFFNISFVDGVFLQLRVTRVTRVECGKNVTRGIVNNDTQIIVKKWNRDDTLLKSQQMVLSSWNLKKKGVGGLKDVAEEIFRRAFQSRLFDAEIIKKLGTKHVKGVLLHGPPGCGKTLLAKTIAEMLNHSTPPKIVNGPEIFNKYIGETERNMRELFRDAELDYEKYGDKSPLHTIIFDEFDSIGKSRSSASSTGTDVGNKVVNQLLTKMEGMSSLNNILIIAMTNRLDILDTALLRPGRFEIQIEIGLPSSEDRKEIFEIHCSGALENQMLAKDVDFDKLAQNTNNFTGAEIEGLVKSACHFAMERVIKVGGQGDKIEINTENDILITKQDFENAMSEVRPQFGIQSHKIFKNRDNVDIPDELKLVTKHDFQTMIIILAIARRNPEIFHKGCNNDDEIIGNYVLSLGVSCVMCLDFFQLIGMNTYQKCVYIKDQYITASKSNEALVIINHLENMLGFHNNINIDLLQTIKTLSNYYDNIKTIIVCDREKSVDLYELNHIDKKINL